MNDDQPRYRRILEWLDAWERIVKQPEEVLLGRSLPNIIDAVRGELGRRTSTKPIRRDKQTGWLGEVLGLLEAALQSSDPTVAMLDSDFHPEVAELRSLLTASEIQQADLERVLDVLSGGPIPDAIGKALLASLALPPGSDDSGLHVPSVLLFRHSIDLQSAHFLADVPKRHLARTGLESIVHPHLESLAASSVTEAAANAATVMAEVPNLSAYLSAHRASLDDALFGMGKEPRWGRRVYAVLRSVARTKQSLEDGTDESARTGEPKVSVPEVLGLAMVQGYVLALSQQVLEAANHAWFDWSNEPIVEMGLPLGDWLAENAKIVDQRGPEFYRPNNRDLFCAKAFGDVLALLVADQIAAEFAQPIWRELALRVGGEIESAFTGAPRAGASESWAGEAENSHIRFLHALADRELQERLGNHLVPVVNRIWDKNRFRSGYAVVAEAIRRTPVSFWEQWLKAAKRQAGWSTEILHFLPWEEAPASLLDTIISDLLSELSPPEEWWGVVLELNGIVPQGQRWEVGTVTFYDTGKYDYGAGNFFGRDRPPLDPVTTAFVSVRGRSAQEVLRAGWQTVETALDALSFDLAHRDREHGIRASVRIPGVIINLERDGWSGGWHEEDMSGRPRHVRKAVDDVVAPLVGPYVALLNRMRGSRPAPDDFVERVLRALRAHREGYWRAPPERFLRYWIGLEQLFAYGEPKETLFELVPKLHITWRDVEGLSISPTWRAKLIEEVRQKADNLWFYSEADPPLRILLTVLEDRIQTLTTSGRDAQAVFRRYTDQPPFADPAGHLRRFLPAIEAEVSYKQARTRFLLRRLYDLRNRVVHEGLAYRSDVEFYAQELEHIFEDILRKIADHLIDPVQGSLRSLPEIIEDVRRPWM